MGTVSVLPSSGQGSQASQGSWEVRPTSVTQSPVIVLRPLIVILFYQVVSRAGLDQSGEGESTMQCHYAALTVIFHFPLLLSPLYYISFTEYRKDYLKM